MEEEDDEERRDSLLTETNQTSKENIGELSFLEGPSPPKIKRETQSAGKDFVSVGQSNEISLIK